jgi:hypothetical protein
MKQEGRRITPSPAQGFDKFSDEYARMNMPIESALACQRIAELETILNRGVSRVTMKPRTRY